MAYAAPPELETYCATISINIPRLRRSRIGEFASSIRTRRRTPNAPPIFARASVNYSCCADARDNPLRRVV
jgi:hypothetical protein